MGVFFMKNLSIERRAIELAHYIINSKDTVRGAASKFGISIERRAERADCFRNYLRS